MIYLDVPLLQNMVLCSWVDGMQQDPAQYLKAFLEAIHTTHLAVACGSPTAAAAPHQRSIIDHIFGVQLCTQVITCACKSPACPACCSILLQMTKITVQATGSSQPPTKLCIAVGPASTIAQISICLHIQSKPDPHWSLSEVPPH